jgi:signal transduction histidine kinase
MSSFRRPAPKPPALRSQVGVALVALAVVSVALAGASVRGASDRELGEFGRRDLQQTADRLAVSAGFAYTAANGFLPRRLRELLVAERAEGHAVAVLDVRRRPVRSSATRIPREHRRAAVVVDGRRVGTVVVGHAAGGFLLVGHGPTSRHLEGALRSAAGARLVESAAIAAALALLLAVGVAVRVTAPLQRVTAVARRMAQGELEARATGTRGSRETGDLAETLDRLAAALRRQEELRRATAADVAHELRNSLCGIVGRVEALQDGVVDDDGEMLARVAAEGRRLGRLVDDVRLLADAQRPGLLVRTRPVALDAIAAATVAAHVDRFRTRGIALDARLAPACADADPQRVEQVLENLLTNALRYTDPGGAVSVAVERRGGRAVLQVTDTGIGIAPEHLGRIFDRFWRVPAARTRAADGSGVGLALVRDLVLAQHGGIDVESRRGVGSTFTVELPLAQPVAAATAAEAPRRGRDALVVDPGSGLGRA